MLGNRFTAATLVAASLLICPAIARAGGFDELPDQGAQALGRGATFTAKADDATALYWNVAGLARQRGTRVQISANLHLNTFHFARAGRYPDDPADPATPWGGKPFPVVSDKNLSFVLPMLVATTDFGIFDRLTFGVGIFGPSATGRTFQIGVNGMPSPSRYDFVQSSSAVIFPTFGAAYRLTPHIDIGVSGHLVLADFNELQISYVDTGSCKNAEYHPCDVEGGLAAKGGSFAGSVGILARPSRSIQIGAQLRSATSVTADGQVTTKLAGAKPSPASLTLDLPWIARLGARYISINKETKFEEWDLEVNGTYETWGSAQAAGPTVTTTDLTGVSQKPTTITSVHKWNDTFSVRVGGAYNIPTGGHSASAPAAGHPADAGGIFTVRAGAFYDSPTTDNAYTRLDANTMAKVAGTAGLGYRVGAFAVNIAYAAVASISRTVTDGEIRPSNGAKEGREVDGKDQPLPPINNGEYQAFTHTISLGIEVNLDTLFRGSERRSSYGDPEIEVLAGSQLLPPSKTEEPSKTDESTDEEARKEKTTPATVPIETVRPPPPREEQVEEQVETKEDEKKPRPNMKKVRRPLPKAAKKSARVSQ